MPASLVLPTPLGVTCRLYQKLLVSCAAAADVRERACTMGGT